MRNNQLNIGIALCHISMRGGRTPGRLEMSDQMSNAVRIFCDQTILGMRKLPMKRFRNRVVARDTSTMNNASNLRFLRRTVSPLWAIQIVRVRTNHHLFSSKILPLSTSESTEKSGLLAKNFCKRFAHITRTNSFCAETPIPASYLFGLTETHSSRRHINKRKQKALFKTWNRYQTKRNFIKSKGTAWSQQEGGIKSIKEKDIPKVIVIHSKTQNQKWNRKSHLLYKFSLLI